jgi:glyoxylase-like metal-dependent hydrolase (beta-lactamase superfamily II)
MEVAQGLHRIEAPLGERYTAMYFLDGSDEGLLFDAGVADSVQSTLLPYLSQIGRDGDSIGWVVTSHADFDHFGGNGVLADVAGRARFGCHELDRPMVEDVERLITDRYGEFAVEHGIADSDEVKDAVRAGTRTSPMQVTYQGGETVRLAGDWTVEVLHTPGHSRGHLSLVDPRSRSVMVSDAILWSTLCTRDGKPAFPPTYRYVDTYLATISRVQSVHPELLLTAHFPVLRGGDVEDFLAESRAFAERLDAALRSELESSTTAVPTRTLVEVLAPRVGNWDDAASLLLVYPLLGHLERLERYRLVERELVGGKAKWSWRR